MGRATGPGIAALIVALWMVACAHGGDAAQARGGPPEAALHVVNSNWSDMTVYAVRNGMRSRLGTVPSMEKRTFRLPGHIVVAGGDFRLEADPLGSSRRYQSPSLVVGPGQVVEWRLENNLSLSSAVIRH